MRCSKKYREEPIEKIMFEEPIKKVKARRQRFRNSKRGRCDCGEAGKSSDEGRQGRLGEWEESCMPFL